MDASVVFRSSSTTVIVESLHGPSKLSIKALFIHVRATEQIRISVHPAQTCTKGYHNNRV